MKIYRPATILVGVLFVLLGGATRLAGPDQVYEKENLVVVHGTIGEKLQYGASTVTIARMKLAKTFLDSSASDDDKPIETNGVYVALEWDTVRGTQKPDTLKATMVADGGTVYTPVGISTNDIQFPEPGFGETGALLFEVNPTDLKGLTVKLEPSMIWTVLGQSVEVDLGIPSEQIAQQLVDGAGALYQMPKPVQRVAS